MGFVTDEDNILTLTEHFNGTITAFVSDYHRCRNKQDVDPKDFVKCKPDTWNKRMIEKKEAR